MIVSMEALVEAGTVCQGRPRVQIESHQLVYFVENGFRVKDIAELFHCSKRTIEGRMAELSIKANSFSTISDTDLDGHVSSVLTNHRQVGEKTITGQ